MSKLLFMDWMSTPIQSRWRWPNKAVRSALTALFRLESVRKLIDKLGKVQDLRACYEAGPTGYVLYWQLTENSGSPAR